jgi:integrase
VGENVGENHIATNRLRFTHTPRVKAMPLTDIACKNAKPRLKLYKLADSAGLCLRVTPAGGKYWVMRYRFDGKEKDLSLGVYPTVPLGAARTARDEAKKALREGRDPAVDKITKRLDTNKSNGNTFQEVADDWLKNRSNRLTPRYKDQIASRLQTDIYPDLGKLPINVITPQQLLRTLKKVQARGAIETSHRLKQYCSMVFRFAIASDMTDRDPASNLKDALITNKSEHYASIESGDLPDLLKKLADPEVGMGMQTRLAMRFLMLTFVRTREMTDATWAEFDLKKKMWIIPAKRMKMGRDHMISLSRQTCEILNTMRKLSNSSYVFPGHHNAHKPMSNMAVLKGLERMGYKGRMTGHGFRALATTILREELKYPYEVVDLQLAHAPRNKIKAAYDRAKFIDERTKMMQVWADYIDKVESGSQS